jgi:hypothetical protein
MDRQKPRDRYRQLHYEDAPQPFDRSRCAKTPESVDPSTGVIVGYARWILPGPHSSSWLEAQVSSIAEEDSRAFEASFKDADWSTRDDMGSFDDTLHKMMQKHTPKKAYMSEHDLSKQSECFRLSMR